jgi:2-dehydro-3-deoxyphosphogluconate aldolase/(4S)-4-hydroxy-2-oxoglutarate aldolase
LPHLGDQTTVDRIGRARLVPVIRTGEAIESIDIALELIDAGLTVLELTATTHLWPDAVTQIRSDHPEICVGVGTVTSDAAARNALDSGAQFLVSPRLVPDVRAFARSTDTLLIEGGMTPTELATALDGGIAKLFPAHVGGPGHLRSILSVVPGAKIIPTGGIPLDDVLAWLAAGAFAVGVGSDLTAGGNVASRVKGIMATDDAR